LLLDWGIGLVRGSGAEVLNAVSHKGSADLRYSTRSPTGASRAVLKKTKHSDRIIVGFAKFFSCAGRSISMSPQQMAMVAHEHGQCRQKARMFRVSPQTINRICQAVAHVTLRVQALQMCKLLLEFECRPPDWAVAVLLWDETGDEQLPVSPTSWTEIVRDRRKALYVQYLAMSISLHTPKLSRLLRKESRQCFVPGQHKAWCGAPVTNATIWNMHRGLMKCSDDTPHWGSLSIPREFAKRIPAESKELPQGVKLRCISRLVALTIWPSQHALRCFGRSQG
jgi:hypothetical protein